MFSSISSPRIWELRRLNPISRVQMKEIERWCMGMYVMKWLEMSTVQGKSYLGIIIICREFKYNTLNQLALLISTSVLIMTITKAGILILICTRYIQSIFYSYIYFFISFQDRVIRAWLIYDLTFINLS